MSLLLLKELILIFLFDERYFLKCPIPPMPFAKITCEDQRFVDELEDGHANRTTN